MWKNIVQRGRPQMTIWRMHISCWLSKATNTHSQNVIYTAFPLLLWLHERASILRYTYVACLVQYLAVRVSASHRGQFYLPDFQILRLISSLFIGIRFFFCVNVVVFKYCEHATRCSEQEDQEEF